MSVSRPITVYVIVFMYLTNSCVICPICHAYLSSELKKYSDRSRQRDQSRVYL